MSQTKAQLIQPIGVVTASGIVVSGVLTASSFDGDIVGSATSIISGGNLNLGIVTAVGTGVTASGFSGDFTGTATGIHTGADIKVGSFTATSFVGDFTGTATSMMRGTGFEAGAVNATGFVANVVGNVTGNTTGLAGSVTSGGNIHVGVITATSYSGDGSNLTGIAATNFNTQVVTANSAETIIDLSDGNCITLNQSADTTVGFASTSTAMSVTIIRDKDDTSTARTITWPSSVKWDGGSAPTLINSPTSGHRQQFQFLTRDGGLTWYGWEDMKYNPAFEVGNTFGIMIWGNNEYGQLGQNSTKDRSSPNRLAGEWQSMNSQFSVGESNYGSKPFATKDGQLYVWGDNAASLGTLGLNDTTLRSSPTLVGEKTYWTGAEGGTSRSTYMVTVDGKAWVWGYNSGGALGLNSTAVTSYSSPVQLGTDTNWKQIASGRSQAFAVKNDGTLWAWGNNNYGILGLNNEGSPARYSSPTQIGTGTDWEQVCSGDNAQNTAAIKTNGTLWTWGNNYEGSLGQNDLVKYSSPNQVPGTNWRTITIAEHTMATKTNGELWMWGYNNRGPLGANDTVSRSSPIQVPGTNWSSLVTCGMHGISAGYKTDGTFWTWGANEDGVLGLNHPNSPSPSTYYGRRSSPMQVEGIYMENPSKDNGGLHIGGKYMMVSVSEIADPPTNPV